MIYAIAISRGVSIDRLKVGVTAGRVSDRLRSFWTVAPEAFVLGLYRGAEPEERQAHHLLAAHRVGRSEVFDVPNAIAAVRLLDENLVCASGEEWRDQIRGFDDREIDRLLKSALALVRSQSANHEIAGALLLALRMIGGGRP